MKFLHILCAAVMLFFGVALAAPAGAADMPESYFKAPPYVCPAKKPWHGEALAAYKAHACADFVEYVPPKSLVSGDGGGGPPPKDEGCTDENGDSCPCTDDEEHPKPPPSGDDPECSGEEDENSDDCRGP
ncbi:MAG: hypothetical protein V4436_02820 [Patescibacteria group bacterium]